jgi:hypothetical protein
MLDQARGLATASTTVMAQARLLEQAGIVLDRALAPAAEQHHLQVEPAARARTVVGWQRRFEHQHARLRAHGATHIGEDADAIPVVVVVHEMADQVDVAALGRRSREYVSGHEAHARERPALAAFGGGDGFRHVEQRRAQLWVGG